MPNGRNICSKSWSPNSCGKWYINRLAPSGPTNLREQFSFIFRTLYFLQGLYHVNPQMCTNTIFESHNNLVSSLYNPNTYLKVHLDVTSAKRKITWRISIVSYSVSKLLIFPKSLRQGCHSNGVLKFPTFSRLFPDQNCNFPCFLPSQNPLTPTHSWK